VTTEFSDWATSCPEYKVTAVQVAPTSLSELDERALTGIDDLSAVTGS
jgi:predicted molibdopterin-dependent oxidoreductase YjgC